MSNKCEAPDTNVDALGAGDSGVGQLKGYFMMLAPWIIWYYVIPAITGCFFDVETELVEVPMTPIYHETPPV